MRSPPLQPLPSLHLAQADPPTSSTAVIFAFAPLPNALCSRCAGADDFSADYSSGPVDFGHFLTSIFLVSGVALPFVLAHAEVIAPTAGWMSALGGAVGYGTSALLPFIPPTLRIAEANLTRPTPIPLFSQS